MSIDVGEVAEKMLSGAKDVLSKEWPEIRSYAEGEFKKLAETLEMIESMRKDGTIDEEEAKIYLDIQKNAAICVMSAIEGISRLAAEKAINAALGIVKDAINGALSFDLL